MKVTLTVEVDVMDGDENVVGTGTMEATLSDDHQVHMADIGLIYDQIRHNFMVEMYEKGLYPTWDTPRMYGTPSRPSRDPRERSYPVPSSTDPIGPPDDPTAGTGASVVRP